MVFPRNLGDVVTTLGATDSKHEPLNCSSRCQCNLWRNTAETLKSGRWQLRIVVFREASCLPVGKMPDCETRLAVFLRVPATYLDAATKRDEIQ